FARRGLARGAGPVRGPQVARAVGNAVRRARARGARAPARGPLRPARGARSPGGPAARRPGGTRIGAVSARCLVGAGSAAARGIVRNALVRAGMGEVVAVASIAAALEACRQPFDLAVVDRDLAQVPGWDWLSELRAKACPEGRLIVVGTRASLEDA